MALCLTVKAAVVLATSCLGVRSGLHLLCLAYGSFAQMSLIAELLNMSAVLANMSAHAMQHWWLIKIYNRPTFEKHTAWLDADTSYGMYSHTPSVMATTQKCLDHIGSFTMILAFVQSSNNKAVGIAQKSLQRQLHHRQHSKLQWWRGHYCR